MKNIDANLVAFAYRGYTNSQGVPTEAGLMLDGIAILDFVKNMQAIDSTKVFVHGRSLGGAVAVSTLEITRHEIAGAILENTFTSIPQMVDNLFPMVAFLKMIVLRNFWPTIDRIGSLKMPLLFVKAINDELVPSTMMNQLYASAVACKHKKMVKSNYYQIV